MKTSRLVTTLGIIGLCLGSALAQAAPGQHDQAARSNPHGQHAKQPAAAHRQRPAVKQPHKTQAQPARQQYRNLPSDFREVHRSVHANRHHIGRGPALPAHVHIVKGKPLPRGWGKRLSPQQLRYLPHYHGYEWRRTGSDLLLVAVATGIVFEVLHGVLD
ncbi:anti-virulence regulator CigR family protein [Pseudomonas sp.]|uniref:anti-virulence regulator CigR family protein n=1 Tax=Pseudomonas sp. TaxID=306 RepID=UPI003D14B6A1